MECGIFMLNCHFLKEAMSRSNKIHEKWENVFEKKVIWNCPIKRRFSQNDIFVTLKTPFFSACNSETNHFFHVHSEHYLIATVRGFCRYIDIWLIYSTFCPKKCAEYAFFVCLYSHFNVSFFLNDISKFPSDSCN